MTLMIAKLVQIVATLTLVNAGCKNRCDFRFDYNYVEEAGGWLKYHRVPVTWAEARMQCHAEGAVLASPLTNKLKAAIVSYVAKQINNKNIIFSGVHATFAKGVYTSVEGVPLLRLAIDWAPGAPDNHENSESCLAMLVRPHYYGSMQDVKCSDVLPYVCYKKYDTSITFNACGPADNGYTLAKTGSCYKLHTKILSWADAYKTCEAEQAHLAIINSDAEAEVVKHILERARSNNFKSKYPHEHAIGYHDWGHTQNFMTIHGQTLDEAGYQKWTYDILSNTSLPETNDFGQMCGGIRTDGRLDVIHCNLPHTFLCEMSPKLRKL